MKAQWRQDNGQNGAGSSGVDPEPLRLSGRYPEGKRNKTNVSYCSVLIAMANILKHMFVF